MAVAAVVLEEPAFAARARSAGHLAGGDPRQAQPPRLPGARARPAGRRHAARAPPHRLLRAARRRRRRHDPRRRGLQLPAAPAASRSSAPSAAGSSSSDPAPAPTTAIRWRRGRAARRRATSWSIGGSSRRPPGRGGSEPRRLLDHARRPPLLRGRRTSARADLRHRRSRVLPAGPLLDRVRRARRATGTWEGDSLLHLHPDAQLRAACAGRPSFIAERSERARASSSCSPAAARCGCRPGSTEPRPQGWYAPRPGRVRAGARAVARGGGYAAAGDGLRAPAAQHRGRRPSPLDSDAFQLRAVLRQGDEEFVDHRRSITTSSWCGGGRHSRAPLATSSVMRASS